MTNMGEICMTNDNTENKAEKAEPKLVKCIKCQSQHEDTYRYWLPVCIKCEKDIEEGDY